MSGFKLTAVALVFVSITGWNAQADLSLSDGVDNTMAGVDESTAAAQADIAQAKSVCDQNPDSDDCQAAQQRAAQDQAQIEANNQTNQRLKEVFGQVSDQQAAAKRQVAGLKTCIYSAMVACTLLQGGGDLTQTSLSGKSHTEQVILPTLPASSVSGSK